MNGNENLANYEKAYNDYVLGMKYADIAKKYNVALSTVKSWKKRYGWIRENIPKKGCVVAKAKVLGNNIEVIKEDLLNQLKSNGSSSEHHIDLVETYIELLKIKNNLIDDIKERGVSIEWFNGKQLGVKKNDSIGELNKTIVTMLKIQDDLGLKPSFNGGGNDDEEL